MKRKTALKVLRRKWTVKETIYVSGPMNGMGRDFNYPAFNAMAKKLRALGYKVLNPAENFNGDRTLPRPTYMRRDFGSVLKCDRVVVLPLWETSVGANLEVMMAREIGIPISQFSGDSLLDVSACEVEAALRVRCAKLRLESTSTSTGNWLVEALSKPEPETVCQEADRLVALDRQNHYGHPLVDFTKQSEILNGYGYRRMRYEDGSHVRLTPRDIPIIMTGVKTARLLNTYKRDSAVDICGYAKTLDMVVERQEKEKSGI